MKQEKKSGKDRTQLATRDETWSDERIKEFLLLEPPQGMPADYNILLKAYRGMTTVLFERFIEIFVKEGHDVGVALPDGSTFLDLVSKHRKSTEYAAILKQASAVKN